MDGESWILEKIVFEVGRTLVVVSCFSGSKKGSYSVGKAPRVSEKVVVSQVGVVLAIVSSLSG